MVNGTTPKPRDRPDKPLTRQWRPDMNTDLTRFARRCRQMAPALTLVLTALHGLAGAADVSAAVPKPVRCDQGDSLAAALKQARPGSTLIVSGTCREAVSITTDRLQLRGIASASLDGSGSNAQAVLSVDGARGVTLKNLVVRGGPNQGLRWTRGAQGRMTKVSATGHGDVGLLIDGADVEVDGLTLTHNGGNGMDAFSGASVIMTGPVVASHNGGDGLAVNAKSYLELRGAQVIANQNAGTGVNIINDSRLQILSFAQAQTSGVTATANGFAGIGLLGATLGVVGQQYFGSGSVVLQASGNAIGMFMPAGAILSPHATARFEISQNGVGMLMEDGASALIVGGLRLSQNQTGLSAVGAGTLTLVSVPPNPSNASGNAQDLVLGFGTRITLDGVAVGSIQCDASVLARGSVSCP